MKKKAVIAVIGFVILMSLITGRSGRKEEITDNYRSETVNEHEENLPSEKTAPAAAEEATEATTEEIPAEESTEGESTGEKSEKEDKVTPEFKKAMDSYEKFFGEYVDFMKEYADSDDMTGMLMEYSEYMTSYAEMMGKLDEIDSDNLSDADYAYYVKVTARIQKKLLELTAEE